MDVKAISGSISFSGKVKAAMNAGKKVQKAVTPKVARAKSSATGAEGDKYIPNFANPDDAKGIVWLDKVQFFPEDIKRMEGMTTKQRIKEKGKLIDQGRYTMPKGN